MNYNTDLSDEEIAQAGEDAIAHFGMKGMRWGVRKKRDDEADSSSGSTPEPLYYDVRQKHQPVRTTAKVAGGVVAATAVVALGATAAAVFMSRSGGMSMKDVVSSIPTKAPKVKKPSFVKSNLQVRSNVPRAFAFDKVFAGVGKAARAGDKVKSTSQFVGNTASVMGNRPRASAFKTVFPAANTAFKGVNKVKRGVNTVQTGNQFASTTLSVIGNRPRAAVFGTVVKAFR